MNTKNSGQLIILAGPSSVGKSPLAKALGRFYPDLYRTMKMLVLFNSREPRSGEIDGVDYYFRSREEINNLRENEQYVVLDARGDLQALDLKELQQQLSKSNVFFEGNPFVGAELLTNPDLERIPKLSMYMSPVSREEILYLKDCDASLNDIITDMMRRKLLRRTQRQKNILSLKDLENIENRASSAYKELQQAYRFSFVIPNHDGEDSENWDAFYYPLGDARKSLLAFVELFTNGKSLNTEKWERDLLD